MEKREFKPFGTISALTLGGGGIGNVWGKTSREESVLSVNLALDLGINHLDVAPSYGKGEAEKVVGEALKGKDHTAVESVFTPVKLMKVFKKCGLSFCFRINGVEREMEENKNKGQTCEINGNVVSSQSFHNCFTAFMKKSKTKHQNPRSSNPKIVSPVSTTCQK